MALDTLRESINAILDDIENYPQDRDRLQAELREKVHEIEAMGLVMPNDLKTLGEEPEEEDEDFFENMPV